MKILLCFGTRPEAIKMAPVIQELNNKKLNYQVCVTAQHREMLDQVLSFFEINPDVDLNLMKPDQGLNELSGRILHKIDKILNEIEPDMVLVQGDTTTALVTALAAFNRQIKIGHVEAGLRTYDKSAPFPEEGNRQLLSRIADQHFVPTEKASRNLLSEGILEKNIFLTGNTVVDALFFGRRKLDNGFTDKVIEELKRKLDPNKKLILVTGHRRENFEKGLEQLCLALKELVSERRVEIVFPVHLNPKVKGIVENKLTGLPSVFLIPPVNYPCLLWLLERCHLIISDSGGIQEESPSFKKPILVTRRNSERPEGVDAGFSFIAGPSKAKIVSLALSLLDSPPDYFKRENPYGDGQAARRIVEIIETTYLL